MVERTESEINKEINLNLAAHFGEMTLKNVQHHFEYRAIVAAQLLEGNICEDTKMELERLLEAVNELIRQHLGLNPIT